MCDRLLILFFVKFIDVVHGMVSECDALLIKMPFSLYKLGDCSCTEKNMLSNNYVSVLKKNFT